MPRAKLCLALVPVLLTAAAAAPGRNTAVVSGSPMPVR